MARKQIKKGSVKLHGRISGYIIMIIIIAIGVKTTLKELDKIAQLHGHTHTHTQLYIYILIER